MKHIITDSGTPKKELVFGVRFQCETNALYLHSTL